MVDELVPYPGFDSPDAEPAVRLIRGLETVDLARYSVVGSYTRFDEAVRNALKDARQRIVGGLQHRGNRRENHLLWAAPGSGKTYLIQQIAESLGDRVQYHEVNLAKCDEGQFRAALGEFD